MRDYEITVLVRPDIDDKKFDSWMKSFESLLGKASAKVKGKIEVSKRALAYEIKKFKEGSYVFCEVSGDSTKLETLDTALKNDDSVLRYLIINSKK